MPVLSSPACTLQPPAYGAPPPGYYPRPPAPAPPPAVSAMRCLGSCGCAVAGWSGLVIRCRHPLQCAARCPLHKPSLASPPLPGPLWWLLSTRPTRWHAAAAAAAVRRAAAACLRWPAARLWSATASRRAPARPPAARHLPWPAAAALLRWPAARRAPAARPRCAAAWRIPRPAAAPLRLLIAWRCSAAVHASSSPVLNWIAQRAVMPAEACRLLLQPKAFANPAPLHTIGLCVCGKDCLLGASGGERMGESMLSMAEHLGWRLPREQAGAQYTCSEIASFLHVWLYVNSLALQRRPWGDMGCVPLSAQHSWAKLCSNSIGRPPTHRFSPALLPKRTRRNNARCRPNAALLNSRACGQERARQRVPRCT